MRFIINTVLQPLNGTLIKHVVEWDFKFLWNSKNVDFHINNGRLNPEMSSVAAN